MPVCQVAGRLAYWLADLRDSLLSSVLACRLAGSVSWMSCLLVGLLACMLFVCLLVWLLAYALVYVTLRRQKTGKNIQRIAKLRVGKIRRNQAGVCEDVRRVVSEVSSYCCYVRVLLRSWGVGVGVLVGVVLLLFVMVVVLAVLVTAVVVVVLLPLLLMMMLLLSSSLFLFLGSWLWRYW